MRIMVVFTNSDFILGTGSNGGPINMVGVVYVINGITEVDTTGTTEIVVVN